MTHKQFAPGQSLPALASSPNYRWYIVGMLWFTGFLNYADRQVIFSLFPLLQEEMNLTPVQLGWLGSAFALVYGLACPFAGTSTPRYTRAACASRSCCGLSDGAKSTAMPEAELITHGLDDDDDGLRIWILHNIMARPQRE